MKKVSLIIAFVGIISFLLISSTAPFKGEFSQFFPKPASHAAVVPPNCPDSLQAKIDAAASGSTLNLTQNCVYRETVSINKPLTINGGNVAQIRGSDLWSGWGQSGNIWTSSNAVPQFTAEPPVAAFVDSFQANHPEQVFFDGNELHQVPSNPTTGQFTLDGSRHIVLADNPSGHIVEVTTRNRWVTINADNVTVTNITLRHAGTSSYEFAIGANNHNNFTLSNSFIADAHGGGYSVGGGDFHAVVRNNTFTNIGCTAIGSYQDGHTTLVGNNIYGNGFGGWDWGWQSGGIKMVSSSNLTVDSNTVHDNNGPGIWNDIGSSNSTWTNNIVYHNVGPQMFFEISVGALITGNKVWSGDNSLPWPAIYVSSSANAEVANNIVAYSDRAIQAYEQDRGDKPTQGVVNTYIHDNTVIMNNDGKLGLMWADCGANCGNGRVVVAGSNNRASNNMFWYSNPEGQTRFQWGNTQYSSIANFSQTPGGATSSYITTAQKDAKLAANNMPACPTCAIPSVTPSPTSTPQTESVFNGPHNLPGTLQAEDYDNGGEGLAYHDVDSGNNGGVYRNDDVDIKATNDTGGGFAVGWIQNGEYLKYTTNVASSGKYNIQARICTNLSDGQTRSLGLAVDGTSVGTFAVPFTATGPNGDWCTFQAVTLSGVQLSSGQHILTMTNTGADFVDFNYLSFTPTATPSPTVSPTPLGSPVPSPIPGDINGSGKVDIFDYNILVGNFGKSGVGAAGGDIDGSGKVDIFDYNIVVGNFGKGG